VPPAAEDGHHAKKKTVVAFEQERPDVVDARRRFRRCLRSWDVSRLVFIDETGVNIALARAEGRAPRGRRLIDHIPTCRWQNYTVIAGLRTDGVVAPMIFPGALNTEALRAWTTHFLLSELRQDDIVVWDNLGVHDDAVVQEAIRSCGARLRFLPPYSPDMNPIELAWSKAKRIMRVIRADTFETLVTATGEALDAITPSDCRGWFKHVGCRIPDPCH
jgi:transposase